MRNAETGAYQVGKRVELLAYHTRLVPPTGDLSIEEVEQETCEREGKRRPEVILVICDEVLGGHEHRKRAAYAVGDGDEVRQSEIPAAWDSQLGGIATRMGWLGLRKNSREK